MNFQRRVDLLDKVLSYMVKKNSVVVCGSGFFYETFLAYMDAELDKLIATKGSLSYFNLKSTEALDRFMTDHKDPSVPIDYMVVIEPPDEDFRQLYNEFLLPLLLERETSRVQVVRPG